VLALEGAVVAFATMAVAAWFGSRSDAWPVLLTAAGGGAAVLRARAGGAPRRPSTRPETIACLALATAYRFPALLFPWGWVNRDGAYGAFVALHLLEGARPAPVFTEGANYQGTLKGHLAAALALVTGSRDLSWLMVLSSLLLYLVFVAASMALARRLGGRVAAAAAGAYLAVSPRFLTVFSLNCVGQYVEVLALGGLALALVARLLREDRHGAAARGDYLAIGVLLGTAFWQQPVALSYLGTVAAALLLRRRTWRDRWTLLVPAGVALGVLPVLLWNAQHGWASADILGREPAELKAQVDALPRLARRAAQISFPILAGLSPGHPWADVPAVAWLAVLVVPGALLAFLAAQGRSIALDARRSGVSAGLLPPLLLVCCLGLFWAVASGRVYWRPRYLLPVLAATAVHLGVSLAWLWARARPAAALALLGLLALNVAGTLPRLRGGRAIAEHYERIVRSLREKGIRTGYADFSLSAPVTMFTAEEIVLSSRLGPTPAYESDRHAQRVARDGPDAYVLRPEDDTAAFGAALGRLGVSFTLDSEPVPVFHALSRRVPVEDVIGAVSGGAAADPDE
jgi:drug/metabolite transporter superfamily protein YnfA